MNNDDDNLVPLPPHDLRAERAVIATMAVAGDDRVLFNRVRRMLWPDAFYLADYGIMFRTMSAMADKAKPIDAISLRAELKAAGLYQEIGGDELLADVMRGLPSMANGPHYAGIVAAAARDRDAIRECNSLAARLMQPHEDGAALIQRHVTKMWKAATSGRDLNVWKLSEAVQRFIDVRANGAQAKVLMTGIPVLDKDYCGVFTKGGYTLVAARPSMGKSTFLRWLLADLAGKGIDVGLIAVEENEDKIAGNVLSSVTSIENAHLAYGKWSQNDTDSIANAAAWIEGFAFHGVDTASNLTDVLTAAELMVTQHGCEVVALDHIHLVDAGRSENRNQQLTEISGALKALFKRLGVVGIVAAQLSRPAEKGREPAPPQLTDLRDSGALEEHADAALMIHRKDYYHRGEDSYTANGLAQVFVRKNRNGRVGEIVLRADLEHQRYEAVDDAFASSAPRVDTGHNFL